VELVKWLQRLGARGLDGVRIAKSPVAGRGMAAFAARSFAVGEELCFVPGDAILTSAALVLQIPDAMPASDDVLEAATSLEARLAGALLREKQRGEASRFAPYIASLPTWDELPSEHPLRWPESTDVDALLDGSSHGRVLATKALEAAHLRAMALLAAGFAVEESEGLWALAIVETRCFSFRAGQPDMELALVPLLDILNTFAEADGYDDELWQASFQPQCAAEDGGVMIVEREIRAGQEIVHLYESNSSARLWTTYGFLPDGPGENPFEGAGVEVELVRSSADDHCTQAKIDALIDAGVELHEGRTLRFELPGDAEVGGALLPAARLLACRDSEQVLRLAPTILEQAEEDGSATPTNLGLQLELEARTLVQEWLEAAIQRADDAAKRLDAELADADANPPKTSSAPLELKKAARRLLQKERPVLEFELRATKDFCEQARGLGYRPWEPLSDASLDTSELVAAFVEERWDECGGWMGAG